MNKCLDCKAEIKLGAKRCRDCANSKNEADRRKYLDQAKIDQPDSICKYCEGKFKKAAGKQKFCGITCRELNTVKNMMNRWLKE